MLEYLKGAVSLIKGQGVLALLAISALSQPLLGGTVEVRKMDGYFEVTLDYRGGADRFQMGLNLARAILAAEPDYEELVDSFLKESIAGGPYRWVGDNVEDLRGQLPAAYAAEIAGLGAGFSGHENRLGDGKLSVDEVLLANLFPDIRPTACSAIAVDGAKSTTGSPQFARLLDWKDGRRDQFARLHAVTRFLYDDGYLVTIGVLGYLGVISGFNQHGVWAGVLDSTTFARYRSEDRHSYPMMLRQALEVGSQQGAWPPNQGAWPPNQGARQLEDVAAVMTDPSYRYSYNHLILLSDSQSMAVLENNFSGSGGAMVQRLRWPGVGLQPGIQQLGPDILVTVNSFQLPGNHRNHNRSHNRARYGSYRNLIAEHGQGAWHLIDLERVASYFTGEQPGRMSRGDIFNNTTQQVILHSAGSESFDVYFRQPDGVGQEGIRFVRIPIEAHQKDVHASIQTDQSRSLSGHGP